MTAPRLEIDLDKIEHNARSLVERLARSGIGVTGVTKATLGEAKIASALLRAGVSGLGDSHIDNLEAMRLARIASTMTLIRTPMLSQADRVVKHADVSFNSELEIIAALSSAAQKAEKTHGVVLMVELGDLREGIMPGDVLDAVAATRCFPKIIFKGIGTNLGCLRGISPDEKNMAALSDLADLIDTKFGPVTDIVSGGNSANINWALSGAKTGRINNLRLGESILFGCETLHRQPIAGLHGDAITLIAEVIEAKTKPSLPWGEVAQNAFGETSPSTDRGPISQAILAIGRQDTDPSGLTPPPGIEIIGSGSDHLILNTGRVHISVGDEISFRVNYSALLRAATSPFVARVFTAPA